MKHINSTFSWIAISALMLTISCHQSSNKDESGEEVYDIQMEYYLQAPEKHYDAEDLAGEAIVLEFWATWCAPCIAMMPHLNELAVKYENRPIRFISVTNESKGKVEHFLKQNRIEGWVGLDTNNSVFRAFNINYIPKTVLIYADGRIAAKTEAVNLTEEILDELISGDTLSLNQGSERNLSINNALSNDNPDPAFYRINIDTTSKTGGLRRTNKTALKAESISVKEYVSHALGMMIYQVLGADDFLNQRLNVDISTPGLSEEQFRKLLIRSLESAFSVKLERKNHPIEIYVLSASDNLGSKLRKDEGDISHMSFDDGVFAANTSSISNLMSQVHQATGKIIVDETNLTGKYSWSLVYDTTNTLSVFDSLESKLGLKVNKQIKEIEMVEVK